MGSDLKDKAVVKNYDVFDPFLRTDTRHKSHECDDRRFFQCLRIVVEEPNFNPDNMGKHFRTEKRVNSDDHPYVERIDDLVHKAWAVRDYLESLRDP